MFKKTKRYQQELSFYDSEFYEFGQKDSLFQNIPGLPKGKDADSDGIPNEDDPDDRNKATKEELEAYQQSTQPKKKPNTVVEKEPEKSLFEKSTRAILGVDTQDQIDVQQDQAAAATQQAKNDAARVLIQNKEAEIKAREAEIKALQELNEKQKILMDRQNALTSAGATLGQARESAQAQKYSAAWQGFGTVAGPDLEVIKNWKQIAADPESTNRLVAVIPTNIILGTLIKAESVVHTTTDSKGNAVKHNEEYIDGRTFDPKDFGTPGKPVTIPDANKYAVSEFGFKREKESVGLISEFQFYIIDKSIKPEYKSTKDEQVVLSQNDFENNLIKVSSAKGENGESIFSYIDKSGNTVQVKNPDEELYAVPDYLSAQDHYVMVKKGVADRTYAEGSLSTFGNKMFPLLREYIPDEKVRREVADIISEFPQDGVMVTLFKLATTLWQASSEGMFGDDAKSEAKEHAEKYGVPEDLEGFMKFIEENGSPEIKTAFEGIKTTMISALDDMEISPLEKQNMLNSLQSSGLSKENIEEFTTMLENLKIPTEEAKLLKDSLLDGFDLTPQEKQDILNGLRASDREIEDVMEEIISIYKMKDASFDGSELMDLAGKISEHLEFETRTTQYFGTERGAIETLRH